MTVNRTRQEYMQLAQSYSGVALLLFFILLNSLFTPNFFQINNLNHIITQICPTILCGMGMTLVISTGGIDISVGAVMAVAGVLTARLMPAAGVVPAVLAALAVSVLVGCFTGILVGRLKLQAMVITLGLMLGLRGVAQVMGGGRDIYFNKLGEVGKQMALWGNYKIGGVIPVQIVPIAVSVLAAWVMVEKTVLGRQIQAVGDNIRSSSLSGIRTAAILMAVYGISSFLGAFAGIFQAAKVSVAAGSSLGQLAELDAIAAVVIGGTPMTGGKAHILGTVVGALIMQMITLTCVMNNIPDQYAQVFKAGMIVFAVFIQREQAR